MLLLLSLSLSRSLGGGICEDRLAACFSAPYTQGDGEDEKGEKKKQRVR